MAAAVSGDIIFVKKGTYNNEHVMTGSKNLTIIGEDCASTIIMNEENNYYLAPIEMASGRLQNLTVYAKDGGTPSGHPQGWYAYALHVENHALYNNTFYVKDCHFIADNNSAVGIGLRGGCHLTFDNCRFTRNGNSYAFYFHDAADEDYVGIQRFTMKDCLLECSGPDAVMRIDSMKMEGTTVYPEFINNYFLSYATDNIGVWYNNNSSGGSATTVGTFNNLINFYKVKTSHGNNILSLNY